MPKVYCYASASDNAIHKLFLNFPFTPASSSLSLLIFLRQKKRGQTLIHDQDVSPFFQDAFHPEDGVVADPVGEEKPVPELPDDLNLPEPHKSSSRGNCHPPRDLFKAGGKECRPRFSQRSHAAPAPYPLSCISASAASALPSNENVLDNPPRPPISLYDPEGKWVG